MSAAEHLAECRFALPDADATLALGGRLRPLFGADTVVYLYGDLGAGKTTLVRGLLRALGYSGAVKSPTYTLIESYPLQRLTVVHSDLYRISEPEELAFLGLDEYPAAERLLLVEWPQHGGALLPPADFRLQLWHRPSGEGRGGSIKALNERAKNLLIRYFPEDFPEDVREG